MAIEFRCTQCGKLLRTGDETAGRQAKCPDCGTVMTVPMAAAAAAGSGPPPLSPPGDSPFAAAGPQPSQPAGPAGVYETPGWAGQGASAAAQRVSAPATALIVTAILGMVLNGTGILLSLLLPGMMMLGTLDKSHPGAAVPAVPPAAYVAVAVVAGLVSLIMEAVVLAGALKMKKLQNYRLAMTAAIIAMIPIPCSPCCSWVVTFMLGVGFGIWALVVLCDSSVKAAFRN